MRQPAAKQDDLIQPVGPHMHQMIVPPSPSSVPAQYPPDVCKWALAGQLSADVFIERKSAATIDSFGFLRVKHQPISPNATFVIPGPALEGKATVKTASVSVFINGKRAARAEDLCDTCNEPVRNLSGKVVVSGSPTVFIGG